MHGGYSSARTSKKRLLHSVFLKSQTKTIGLGHIAYASIEMYQYQGVCLEALKVKTRSYLVYETMGCNIYTVPGQAYIK